MKKILALTLSFLMLLSLTACSGGDTDTAGGNSGAKTYYFGNPTAEDYANVENPIDPDALYKSLEYTEKMLYGRYWLNNEESEVADHYTNTSKMELDCYLMYGDKGEAATKEVPVLPFKVFNGGPSLEGSGSKLSMVYDHEWAVLRFATSESGSIDVICAYTVSGNTVTYTPLEYYEIVRDDDYNVTEIKYNLGKTTLEYNFSIKGYKMTLSKGEESVDYYAYMFSDNRSTDTPSVGGYCAVNSPVLANMDNVSGSIYDTGSSACYITNRQSELNSDSGFAISDNGVITFCWVNTDENGNQTKEVKQYLYFMHHYGMTFYDGEVVYYYTDNYTSRSAAALADGLSVKEAAAINALTESELKKIEETKANLLTDLAAALDKAGVKATVNKVTGEISLDSTVLFGVDESAVSADGKEFLKKFLGVYTSTVFNDKYKDFVSKIIVEGHTDTSAGYDYNLKLSKDRAEAVKNFCLSSESGVDAAYTSALSSSLEAIGYSYDRPVYGDDGKVDMAASRRVSFRFTVNLTK